MRCPKCGNENPPKLKFCVKCGTNIEDPQEINYEQVDMGHYHSEEDGESGGFSLGSGTFTIKDTAPLSDSSDLYTAAELNDDDEEFDFSSFDEPFIPKLDTGRVALPKPSENRHPNGHSGVYGNYSSPVQGGPPQMGGMPQMNRPPQMGGMPQMNGQPQMGGMPQMNGQPQMGGMPQMNGQPQMGGMPQMNGQPQMGGMPQMNGQPQMGGMPQMNGQPQMGGMPQMNGQPQMGGMPQMNGQPQMGGMPQMGGQPQIVGYDPSGMPIYGQPMMYGQPQIVGYDPSGMPIYGQPAMYGQPQIVGYDPSGMPIYSQPMMYGQPQIGGMPQMGGQPQMGGVQQNPFAQPQNRNPVQEEKRVEVPDDFWEFFDGGKKTEHAEPADDFFGKHDGQSSSSDDRLKRFEKKKIDYMGDTPLVDAAGLAPNTAAKFNKLYMKATEQVNADDLKAKEEYKAYNYMGKTKDVNADDLDAYTQKRSQVTMSVTEEADADQLESYNPEHREAIMAQADHAVEAMPKKKAMYVDELDQIELPDYMQARKTDREESPEIPGLPEFYKNQK